MGRVRREGKWSGVPHEKWTAEEDELLRSAVSGIAAWPPNRGYWVRVASMVGSRSPRQCRQRWVYHLNPELSDRVSVWTDEEDARLRALRASSVTAQWTEWSHQFVGRTGRDLKNRWYHRLDAASVAQQKERDRVGRMERQRYEAHLMTESAAVGVPATAAAWGDACGIEQWCIVLAPDAGIERPSDPFHVGLGCDHGLVRSLSQVCL